MEIASEVLSMVLGIALAMAGIVAVSARKYQRMLAGYGERCSFPAAVRYLLSR